MEGSQVAGMEPKLRETGLIPTGAVGVGRLSWVGVHRSEQRLGEIAKWHWALLGDLVPVYQRWALETNMHQRLSSSS